MIIQIMGTEETIEEQAFSQNLKSGHPGGMSPHKFVKALVHFASFSPRIGRPQDTLLAKSLLRRRCRSVEQSLSVLT